MNISLNMNDKQFSRVLRNIATKDILEQQDGWARVAAHLPATHNRPTHRLLLLRKLTSALIITLMILLATTTVYAFYQGIIKISWLQAILDAQTQTELQLEQTLEVTLATPTPISEVSSTPQVLNISPIITRTVSVLPNGPALFPLDPISATYNTTATLTAKLDWAYVDASRVVISATLRGEPKVLNQYMILHPFHELSTMQGEKFYTSYGMSTFKVAPDVLGCILTFEHDKPIQSGDMLDLRLRLKFQRVNPSEDTYELEDNTAFDFDLHLEAQGEVRYVEPQLTAMANGITMTLESIEIMPTTVKLHLCYDLPSSRDWKPQHTALLVDNYEGQRSGVSLVDGKNSQMDVHTARCVELVYDIGLVQKDIPTTLYYTVERLQTSFSESPSPQVLERAYQRLAEKGIDMEFIFDDHGMRFKIYKQPEDWEAYEVNTLIFDSLCDWHEGPWIFEVDLSEVVPVP